MASFRFLLQSKQAPANIYVQLSVARGKVFKRKTGYSIDPANWGKKGFPIDKNENLKNLKSSLSRLKSDLETCLNGSVASKVEVDGDWLQNQIDQINGVSKATDKDKLTNHIQYIIDNAHRIKKSNNRIGLSKSRIKSYKLFKNTVIRFERETNKGQAYLLKNINFDFGESFTEWLFSKGYSVNYVGKNIDNLKAVCHDAEKRGLETSPQLKRISSFTKSTDSEDVIILTPEEQETIAETSLEREALVNARKWLLLGCQLGQRFGDLIRVTPEMVKASNGIKIIELTQKKTGKMVAIPLMPKAIEIIEGDMPYPISIQNFNDYVKDICKAAKLEEPIKGAKYIKLEEPDPNQPKTPGIYPKWELIGSHVCRRSFASNLYGKIPTPILINITGHGTEKMFLRYIGRTAYDNAHQMMEYFGKLQAKEKKEPQLQVLKSAN